MRAIPYIVHEPDTRFKDRVDHVQRLLSALRSTSDNRDTIRWGAAKMRSYASTANRNVASILMNPTPYTNAMREMRRLGEERVERLGHIANRAHAQASNRNKEELRWFINSLRRAYSRKAK